MKRWILLSLLACSSLLPAAPPPAAVHAEIDALLQALSNSDCEFYRNGSWYPGSRAASHLQRKLDYFERKGLISDAESFVDAAATRSSLSGEAYQVRCPGHPAEPSAQWLNQKLEQFRAGAAEPRH